MARYEVVEMIATVGWVMVGDTEAAETPAVALFHDDYRDIAQEMADRLNLRQLAGRS